MRKLPLTANQQQQGDSDKLAVQDRLDKVEGRLSKVERRVANLSAEQESLRR